MQGLCVAAEVGFMPLQIYKGLSLFRSLASPEGLWSAEPASTAKGNVGGKVGRRQHFQEPITKATVCSSP